MSSLHIHLHVLEEVLLLLKHCWRVILGTVSGSYILEFVNVSEKSPNLSPELALCPWRCCHVGPAGKTRGVLLPSRAERDGVAAQKAVKSDVPHITVSSSLSSELMTMLQSSAEGMEWR